MSYSRGPHYTEYAAWIAEARNMAFQERVSRCVAVPTAFTVEETRELNKMFEERGMRLTSSSYTCNGHANPWKELELGQKLVKEIVRYERRAGKRYSVEITREPDGPEIWLLTLNGRYLADGESRETLIAALDARSTTQRMQQ